MYRPESCRANMNNTTMLFFWIPWRVAILRRKRWSTRGYWAPKVGMYINTNFERASTCWWLNHAWSKYESPLGGPFWRGGVGNLLPIQLNNHRHDPNLPKQQLNLQMQVILCSMFFLELPTPGSLFAYTLTVLATEGKIETGCLRELAGLGFDASSTWFCLCRHSFKPHVRMISHPLAIFECWRGRRQREWGQCRCAMALTWWEDSSIHKSS